MKSFTSVDEIVKFSASQSIKAQKRLGIIMRVTYPRFDQWFTKGFEGLRNLIGDRSSQDVLPSYQLLEAIDRLVKVIEKIPETVHESPKEVSDEALAEATTRMAEFLESRMLVGKLPKEYSINLLSMYHPLKTALLRLEAYGKSS